LLACRRRTHGDGAEKGLAVMQVIIWQKGDGNNHRAGFHRWHGLGPKLYCSVDVEHQAWQRGSWVRIGDRSSRDKVRGVPVPGTQTVGARDLDLPEPSNKIKCICVPGVNKVKPWRATKTYRDSESRKRA